jgi:hypothetical protein
VAGLLGGAEVSRGLLASASICLDLIGDLLTLCEAAHARPLDRTDVHEYVLAALIGLNEAVALLFVEPLPVPVAIVGCPFTAGCVSAAPVIGRRLDCRSSGGVV